MVSGVLIWYLIILLLKKLKVASGASRSKYSIIFKLNIPKRNKKLSLKKSNSNNHKSISGKIVCFSKSSIKRRYSFLKINYRYRFTATGVISSFNFFNLNRSVSTLISYSNGMFSYILASKNYKIFSYFMARQVKKLKKFFMESHFDLAHKAKLHSLVSNVEVLPGVGGKYVRSSGTKSNVLKIDHTNLRVVVRLPSFRRKSISFFSIIFFNKILNFGKKKKPLTKSGDWRSMGYKPMVRGVAKNPVDHPHGGRTKSIKLPRTP